MKPVFANLNFTNRRKINRDQVRISGNSDALGGFFLLEKCDLDQLGLPGDSIVVVEATTQRFGYSRYELGTIASISMAARMEMNADCQESASLKIMVVESGGTGKILASAEKLKAIVGGKSGSLLPLVLRPLESLVWRLDLKDDGAELHINERLHDAREVSRSDWFSATVLPEVVYRVALWVIASSVSDEHVPSKKWRQLFKQWGHEFDATEEVRGDLEHCENWAEEVAHTFSRRQGFFETFNRNRAQEGR